jgi:hypothetical protein
MDSRIFIKTATQLRQEIKDFSESNLSNDEAQTQGGALQKDINAAFASLQNPTLPSAEKLRDEALDAGFAVNPAVAQRIHEAGRCWQN